VESYVSSISSFWLWRVDANIVNGTPINLFLTMSSGDWSCLELGCIAREIEIGWCV